MPDQEAMTDERRSTPRTDAVAEIAFNACNTPGEVVFADFARELEREIAGLRAAIQSAHDELMNMQPHIESCCLPRMAPIIDAHVDVVMETLSKALAGEAGNTSNEL